MINTMSVFDAKQKDDNSEIVTKEELRKHLGIKGNCGTNNEEITVHNYWEMFNQIGVVHYWDEKGEYEGAEIPNHYFRLLRNFNRGHKKGESSALH